jgi:hypothetical protein
LRTFKKYQFYFPVRTIATIFFIFISFKIVAQEPPVLDTVAATQEGDSDTTVPGTSSQYFSKRNTLVTDTFNLRHLPDSVIQKMRQDNDFWYANSVFDKPAEKKKNDSDKTPLGQQAWFQTLMWLIIIGGFAAFIMIYLANSDVSLFRRKPRSIADATDDVETDDIFAINYSKEIEKAVSLSNYRFAVRLMFLRLLKRLSEKNIIQYRQGKTNFDYLLQLEPTSYYHDFFRLTRNYEYSWYGQFDISSEKFSVIKNDFEKLEQRIG